MGETWVCDICDRRIESGYTVSWTPTLKDSACGIHFSRTETTNNICEDCWPGATTQRGKVRALLEKLGVWTDGGSA